MMQEADLDGDGNINYQGKLKKIYLFSWIILFNSFFTLRIHYNDDKTSMKQNISHNQLYIVYNTYFTFILDTISSIQQMKSKLL